MRDKREAAVEKAARAIYECMFTRPKWKDVMLSLQNYYRKDAEAALKSVGYFKLVEAATAFLAGVPVLDTDLGQCRLQDELAAALPARKEASPDGSRKG